MRLVVCERLATYIDGEWRHGAEETNINNHDVTRCTFMTLAQCFKW